MNMEAVTKLNDVLKVLLAGKLKKDIDDTILEKLLNLLQSNFRKNEILFGDPISVLQKTEFLHLFENAFNHLMNASCETDNANILSFTIRAFGIFLSQKEGFGFIKQNSIVLEQFSKLSVKDFSVHKPSIHSAFLISLRNILDHSDGVSWFLNVEGIVDNVFKSFSASSYYIRRDAKTLLTHLLICISSDDFKNDNKVCHLFDDLMSNKIVPAITSPGDSSTKNSCIFLLLDSMKNVLFNNQYNLLEKVIQCFEYPNDKLLDDNMILLLVDCYIYTKVKKPDVIVNILDKLMERQLIDLALNLTAIMLLKKSEGIFDAEYMNLGDFVTDVNFILRPLLMCTNVSPSSMVIEKYQSAFAIAMESKEWSSIVNTALKCSKIVVPTLKCDDLSEVISVLSDISSECFSEKKLLNFENIFRNKQTQRSVMDLACIIIDHKGFSTLDSKYHKVLLDGLIHRLKIEYDINILCSTLTVINNLLKVIDVDAVYSEEFCDILYKKMLSCHWSIADNALEILYNILCKCTDCNFFWLEKLCSENIFSMVWILAIGNQADDYVKVTATKVLTLFYTNEILWQRTSTLKVINLETFMAAIISLAVDKDAPFIQRAVITALKQWLDLPKFVESKYYQLIPTILLKLIQVSSDSECKIIALFAWQNMNKNVLSNISTINDKKIAAGKLLQFFSKNFYILALLLAVEDIYLTVRISAIKAFLELREKIVQLGITKDDVIFSGNDILSSCENCEIRLDNSIHDRNFSSEEKHSGIDYIMNKTTLELIQTISTPISLNTNVKSTLNPLDIIAKPCCQNRFWEKLWSRDLDSKLAIYSQSSDVYDQNPITLLDDILAAKTLDDSSNIFGDGYEAMDCY